MTGDNPFVRSVAPKRSANGGVTVVMLDRIEPGVTPDYCVHGKVTCHWCPEWCWLGDNTYELVASGEAAPMCRQCGAEWIPKGMTPMGNAEDHRRADGPH